MRKALISLLIACGVTSVSAQETEIINTDFNCFTVVVGKDASADGSVILAHNEDDSGEQFLNYYTVSGKDRANGEFMKLKRGGNWEYPSRTAKFFWMELPKMEVSDSFLNEYGVAVTSDGCPSREDHEDYTDGGMLFEIRLIAAKTARTAREGAEIVGALIEKYGYADSGRTYFLQIVKRHGLSQ